MSNCERVSDEKKRRARNRWLLAFVVFEICHLISVGFAVVNPMEDLASLSGAMTSALGLERAVEAWSAASRYSKDTIITSYAISICAALIVVIGTLFKGWSEVSQGMCRMLREHWLLFGFLLATTFVAYGIPSVMFSEPHGSATYVSFSTMFGFLIVNLNASLTAYLLTEQVNCILRLSMTVLQNTRMTNDGE